MMVKHIAWSRPAIFGLLAAAAATVIYRDDILVLLQEPPTLNVYDDDINDNGRKIRQDAQLSGEWQFLPPGLGLRSGDAGEVIYKVTKEADEDVHLVLWYYWNELRQTLVEVSVNGSDYMKVLENVHSTGRSLRLTAYAIGSREIWIRLTARFAAADSYEPWIVLDKIQIVKVKNPIDLPYLPGLFLFVAIPLTVFTLARRYERPVGIKLAAIALAIETVLSWLWPQWIRAGFSVPLPTDSGIPQVRIPWIWLGYSIGVAGPALKKSRTLSASFLLPMMIALALILRWEALIEFQYRPLDPDAVGYRKIADDMKHAYDTSFREPLWIWTIKIWFALLGSSDLNLRLLSLLLSLLILVAAYKLFNDCVQEPGATQMAVALLAVHPYLIFMSIRGLRLELYTLAILLLTRHVLLPGEKTTAGGRTAGLAVWGTAAVMTQLNSLVFVPLLWGYAFWRHKTGWRRVWIPFGTMAMLLLPYLLYCYRQYGDPFWSTNVYAKWYRNYEYLERLRVGCDGCPSFEEYQADAHSGARVTSFHYVFGMHSIKEVAERTAKGLADLFMRPSPYFWKQVGVELSLFYYVYLVGTAGVLLSPARILLIVQVATINLLAFLVPLGVDARLVEHTAPFACFMVGYGLTILAKCCWWAMRFVRKGEGTRRRRNLREKVMDA